MELIQVRVPPRDCRVAFPIALDARKWFARSRARRCHVVCEVGGVTRMLYRCTFVTEPRREGMGETWEERDIEFFAERPGEAVKAICAAGVPMRLDKAIIN